MWEAKKTGSSTDHPGYRIGSSCSLPGEGHWWHTLPGDQSAAFPWELLKKHNRECSAPHLWALRDPSSCLPSGLLCLWEGLHCWPVRNSSIKLQHWAPNAIILARELWSAGWELSQLKQGYQLAQVRSFPLSGHCFPTSWWYTSGIAVQQKVDMISTGASQARTGMLAPLCTSCVTYPNSPKPLRDSEKLGYCREMVKMEKNVCKPPSKCL